MSSFITPVENLPIVFIGFLEKISHKELQAIFQNMKPLIEEHRQFVWILDVTCWDVTRDVLTYLAGTMAVKEAGSFADCNVTTFLVSKDDVTDAMRASFQDHYTDLGMVPCDSLTTAYTIALNIVNGWA